MFSSVYYNTRTDQFFDFYKEEIIAQDLKPSPTCYALAAMEKAGKLQCCINSDVFELPQRAGCKRAINLRGDRLSEPLSPLWTGVFHCVYPPGQRRSSV